MGCLYNELKKYTDRVYPMHMPGHKAGRLGVHKEMYEIDVTEVEGTDDLHDPTSIIKKAQERAAKLFGAKKTHFLVNGSTVGLMAAITAIAGPNDELLVARNCHRSVYDGLVTTGIRPIYVQPELMGNGLVGGISVKKVERLLEQYPRVKGFILTSPTYEGFVSDIEGLASLLHKNNKILIVDEAHGAHFVFHNFFPRTALSMGADIVIQSTHKTLPSITQTAMLHLGSDRVDEQRVSKALALYETSSPSYVMMVSLDDCCQLLEEEGQQLFDDYVSHLQEFYSTSESLKNINVMTREDIDRKGEILDFDRGKLVIQLGKTGSNGHEFDNLLRKKYNIQIEMASSQYVLGMTSIADTIDGIRAFTKALSEIDDGMKSADRHIMKKTNSIKEGLDRAYEPDTQLSPREAYFAQTRTVTLSESEGSLSGDYVIPYPPGIPLVVPGERFTKEVIQLIKEYKSKGLKVIGSEKLKIIEG